MSATVFNSAFWFQNEIYQDFEDKVYANKKQIREDFEEFLIANLEELEFKKNKKKSRHSDSICYEYVFEEDTNHKIRVTDDSDGIHIIPLYKNKINEDISEEIVDRDKGEIFRQLMDRILDALEVIECTIFDIETKTQTNLTRTPKAIKRGKKIAAKLSSKKGGKKYNKKDETTEEFDPEEEESEEEQEEEDESESFEEFQVSKRRSKRLRKRKKKLIENGNENGMILIVKVMGIIMMTVIVIMIIIINQKGKDEN
eukprot:374951_1